MSVRRKVRGLPEEKPVSEPAHVVADGADDSDADGSASTKVSANESGVVASKKRGTKKLKAREQSLRKKNQPEGTMSAAEEFLQLDASGKKMEKNAGLASGVIYVGHIPYGFFEHQMKAYFSQFGNVSNVRMSRNRKSGKPKGFAFIEFQDPEVARIAAETMNGNKKFHKIPWRKITREQVNKPKTAEERAQLEKRHTAKNNQRKRKLAELGIDYELPSFQKLDKSDESTPKKAAKVAESSTPKDSSNKTKNKKSPNKTPKASPSPSPKAAAKPKKPASKPLPKAAPKPKAKAPSKAAPKAEKKTVSSPSPSPAPSPKAPKAAKAQAKPKADAKPKKAVTASKDSKKQKADSPAKSNKSIEESLKAKKPIAKKTPARKTSVKVAKVAKK